MITPFCVRINTLCPCRRLTNFLWVHHSPIRNTDRYLFLYFSMEELSFFFFFFPFPHQSNKSYLRNYIQTRNLFSPLLSKGHTFHCLCPSVVSSLLLLSFFEHPKVRLLCYNYGLLLLYARISVGSRALKIQTIRKDREQKKKNGIENQKEQSSTE